MTALPGAPAADDPAWPDDAIEVARIGEAWGVKGWFRVHTFAENPEAVFSSKRWFLQPPDAPFRRPGVALPPALLRIVQCKEHGDGVVAQANDVADRAAAEALRGARIFISRASFPTAGADEFYWIDLIGLSVVNLQGEPLGAVVGLLDTGPHSVLRVQAEAAGAEERLIPFVAAFVTDVDLPQRRITVDWGLDY